LLCGSIAQSSLKLGNVIDCPVAECPCRCPRNIRDSGCNKCRLADRGCPRVQQHIYNWQRYHSQQLATRFCRRYFFEAQRTSDRFTDYAYLLELAQGLRPGQNIFRSVPVLTQGAHRDCSNIALMDRRSWRLCVGPAHDVGVARIFGAHQRSAFAANIPGRRNVRWSPEVSISRSISA